MSQFDEETVQPDAAGEAGPGPHLYFEKAYHLADIGQTPAALKVLQEGISRYPEDPQLHAQVAHVHFMAAQFEEAEDCARHALAMDPESDLAAFVLAECLSERGDHQAAELVILDALRSEPNDTDLLVSYARLMFKTGQLDKSKRLLLRSLSLDPELPEALALRSLIDSEQRNSAASLESSSKALGLAPDKAYAHYTRGLTLYQSGHPFKARQQLREALRLEPGDEDYEEMYLEADKACRPVYLVFYYWSLLLGKLPGEQFLVWGLFLGTAYGMQALQVHDAIQMIVIFGYLGLCIYTWMAEPLIRMWVRIFPPKF